MNGKSNGNGAVHGPTLSSAAEAVAEEAKENIFLFCPNVIGKLLLKISTNRGFWL